MTTPTTTRPVPRPPRRVPAWERTKRWWRWQRSRVAQLLVWLIGLALPVVGAVWVLVGFRHLDPCRRFVLEAFCEAAPAALRVGQLAVAITGAAVLGVTGVALVLWERAAVRSAVLRMLATAAVALVAAWIALFGLAWWWVRLG